MLTRGQRIREAPQWLAAWSAVGVHEP